MRTTNLRRVGVAGITVMAIVGAAMLWMGTPRERQTPQRASRIGGKMPITINWQNGSGTPKRVASTHWVKTSDPTEIASEINRRRLLVYLNEQDFSSQIGSDKPIRATTWAGQAPPPFKNFRGNLSNDIIAPVTGGLGGDPASPSYMQWLWPEADADEDKVIVFCSPGSGQVGMMEKLNGTTSWTDPALALALIRAVHTNELRWVCEHLCRGRWKFPVYWSGGILSLLPDVPWIGDSIAHNEYGELRCVGLMLMRTADSPPRGLVNVTVCSATLTVTADLDCQVELYHCLRAIDFINDPPTWNQPWSTPGGTGSGDATAIGSLSLTGGTPGSLTNAALAAAVQAMIDGAEMNLLIRRSDTGWETIGVSTELSVDFDLD